MRLLPPLALAATLASAAHAAPPDYARDVKPLFARHCVGCHGPQKQKAGLRLDTAAGVLAGGDAGPVVVAGRPDKSPLLAAVRGTGESGVMPPKGPPLAAAEIDALAAWVKAGAKGPAAEQAAAVKPVTSDHWAFRPVGRPAPPAVGDAAGVRNPIDRFVRAKLDAAGLTPSPEADRATLARRLSLDLTGLPPTPAEVEAFVNDSSPDAYERLVERLLASPAYGERQARAWLDLARYADSDGYNFDAPRSVWPYRDWVVAAFNRDLPFDRFVVEQLAGDLLPGATVEQLVASGFNRNSLFNEEGGVDPEQRRNEIVIDRVNATGTAFLGLTVGCAQCHDHKFDPLSQREFYQLFAFFNSADDRPVDVVPDAARPRREAVKAQVAALRAELEAYGKSIDPGAAAWEAKLTGADRKALPTAVRAALDAPPEARERYPEFKGKVTAHFRSLDEGYRERQKGIAELQRRLPPAPTSLAMGELATPRPTFVHVRGDFLRKGVPVEPAWPAVLDTGAKAAGRRNRLDLAKWLADPRHPLTARVAVNRLWQQLFGVGLVETPEDFGTQGSPPTHPELLDWLAGEFARSGWSGKHMTRLVVTSATYRQASKARPDAAAKDPRNKLLARQNRVRLEAEAVRDAALTASGLLTRKVGGPGVYPPQPDSLQAYARTAKKWPTSTGPDRYRRGLYTFFFRTLPHPALAVFDAPDASAACARRNRSTTPLQALTLANDESFHECARALGRRVLAAGDDAARTELAFRLALGRGPTTTERSAVAGLLAKARALPDAAADEGRWTLAARVVLNLDEFQTRE